MFVQGTIQSQRHRRAQPFDLIGLRVDQHLDRIADGVHAEKYEYRHHQQHKTGLGETAEGVGEHELVSGLRKLSG